MSTSGEPGAEPEAETPAAEPVPCDEPDPDSEDAAVLPDVSPVALRNELHRRVRADHLDPADGRPQPPIAGRHARGDGLRDSSQGDYVPRHAVSTPGPSAPSTDAATEQFARLGRDPTEPSFPAVDESAGTGSRAVEHLRRSDPTAPAPGPTAPVAGASVIDGKGGTNGMPAVTSVAGPSEPGAATGSAAAEPATSGRRVRVVLAQRKGTTRPVRTVVDVQEMTPVGETLSTSLIRSQLALALRIGGIVLIALGSLPAIFVIFPVLGRVELFGLRLPWLLLGVLSYPFLLGLAHLHARSAERLEQVFVDHIQN